MSISILVRQKLSMNPTHDCNTLTSNGEALRVPKKSKSGKYNKAVRGKQVREVHLVNKVDDEMTVVTEKTRLKAAFPGINSDPSIQDTVLGKARLILACGSCPIIVVLGAQIAWNYYRSCKLIFRTVGSLENLQGMCKNMFIFFGLLQMDLQLGASVTVVVLTKGDVVSTSQLVLLCVVGFLTLSSSLFGYFGVRLENRKLMYIYAGLWIFLPAYAIYSIVQTAVNQHGNTPVGQDTLGIVTYICCVLSICTRAVIPYLGCKVYRSFGNGLKERVYNRDGDHQYSSLP